jgi:hypothetical protein
MLRASARGRHAAVLRELQMPVPFDLGQFVAGVERQRRRPIRLRPFISGPGCPCGLWIGTAEADYIYHEAGTTPFHATHIALHEIAHMLLGHEHSAAWEQLIKLLAPDVDQALIKLILGRSAYTSTEERDAESLASLNLSSTTRRHRHAEYRPPKLGVKQMDLTSYILRTTTRWYSGAGGPKRLRRLAGRTMRTALPPGLR